MGDVMNQPDSSDNPTILLRRLHRWRMAFFGLMILLAGITIGAAGALLVVRPDEGPGPPLDPEMAVRLLLTRFREELRITDDQADQIRALLRTRMQNLHKLREEARPKIEEQLQGIKKEIGAVLTEEQRGRWEGIVERLEREFHRGMRRGPGGPGGPGGSRDRNGFREGRDRFRGPGRPGAPRGEGPPWQRGPGREPPPPPPEGQAQPEPADVNET